MKLLVSLLSLLALSSASLPDIVEKSSPIQKASELNPELEDRIPVLTASGSQLAHLAPLKLKNQNQSSFNFESTTLQWQAWPGYLPYGAVGIYNEYAGRHDYVCQYECEAGFYNRDLGSYCRFPYAGKEHLGSPFQILVNTDNLELLEWIDGSWGSVPPNYIKSCPSYDVHIAKNKYGLGKVVPKHEAFFLPWEGTEYSYRNYQVLTINKDVRSWHMSEVRYNITGVEVWVYPPEILYKSTVTNDECKPSMKMLAVHKVIDEEQRWDIGSATTMGVGGSITAQIPLINRSIDLSTETTKLFSSGTTIREAKIYSISVEINIPAKHSCDVNMVGYKHKADIPFTARLRRTYGNGQTRSATIAGVYDSIQLGVVQAEVEPCKPIPNESCP